VPNPEVAGRWTAPGAPKSEIQFSCVGGLLTYISFTHRNVFECACGWSKVRRRIGAQAPPLPRSACSRVPLDGTCSSKTVCGSHDSDWWLCATGGARADKTLLRINPVILSCCFHFTLPDGLKLVALSESLAIQFGDAGRPELDARSLRLGYGKTKILRSPRRFDCGQDHFADGCRMP